MLKKKTVLPYLATIILTLCFITACSSSKPNYNVDLDKCISKIKSTLPVSIDYPYVRDYHIEVNNKDITITAVVDDATDPNKALDFADTLIRQLNLYAVEQDSSIAASSKDNYGGLYDEYSALVGVAPNSKTNDKNSWFINDAITSSSDMVKLK